MDKYSFLEKLIHDFCLGNNFVKRSLYEVEKILFYKKDKNFVNKNHVFITGLPRAGTTAILEFIFSSKKFAESVFTRKVQILKDGKKIAEVNKSLVKIFTLSATINTL